MFPISTKPSKPGLARALVLLAAAAMTLLACQQGRRGPIPYALQTDDARGLKKNAPIYVAGVQVGQVRAVGLEGRKAKVELALDKSMELLPMGTCARITSYGPGEPTHVALDLPAGGKPLAEGEVITCVSSQGSHDQQLGKILGSLATIFDAAAKRKGVVGRLLHDGQLADRFERWLSGAFADPRKDDKEEADEAAEPDEEEAEAAAPDPAAAPPPVVAPAPAPAPRPKPKPKSADIEAPF